jgi:hypothetical protein
MRPGNRVTLYHDSTCAPGPVEGIRLAGGGLFSESSCWDDIYDAIMEADRWGALCVTDAGPGAGVRGQGEGSCSAAAVL